ncbi:hypothetical protein H9Q13_08650 [Pontibacter sp. JH31]|uniref:Uncharacterized protein n=1 Tax=Pontibacter aquaedesilientis TaxID=2766980 RepID=A0ABR7XH16_9BACT|nr:hypothetical protein [Pontibacter aquaedesilientis]MBD1397231.1 hypothetical protein [Pontibacter aquaedesilientis]
MKNVLLRVALAGVLALPSCTLPNMAVEPTFKEQSQELTVEGRKAYKPNGSFMVGNYRVAQVNRGWRNASGFSMLGYENIKMNQRYEFSLQSPAGDQWFAFGASRLQEKNLRSDNGITLAVGKNLEYFVTHFTSPVSGQWCLLTVDPGQYVLRKKFEGELSNGGQHYKIAPIYKLEGSKLPAGDIVGYEFLQDGKRMAAVQVINHGKVWLAKELEEDSRMVLLTAASSLLLYDKLQGTTDEMADMR